ncbi:MAG: hypothetical protein Q9227_002192 [Pyrenula ochraceoflavens]
MRSTIEGSEKTDKAQGIGEALADKFVQEGSQVIAVGRRKEKLEEIVHRNGKDKASAVPFDITNLDAIPNFVNKCTNYISYIALTKAFLPFLLEKRSESALIFTTSGLGIVPMVRAPNYCASKAALHQFILVLREQLKQSRVKVIEIFPPAVQTELHDEKHQPDIKNGRSIGVPLADFTEAAYAGLSAGKEQIPVEKAESWFNQVETPRQEAFDNVKVAMAKMVENK